MAKKIKTRLSNDRLITLGLRKLFLSFLSKHKLIFLFEKFQHERQWKTGSDKRVLVSTQRLGLIRTVAGRVDWA